MAFLLRPDTDRHVLIPFLKYKSFSSCSSTVPVYRNDCIFLLYNTAQLVAGLGMRAGADARGVPLRARSLKPGGPRGSG